MYFSVELVQKTEVFKRIQNINRCGRGFVPAAVGQKKFPHKFECHR